jgi:hypothetical protein
LSEEAIRRSGLFNPVAVSQLARKAASRRSPSVEDPRQGGSGAALSEVEDMALTGVLSAQLVHQQIVEGQRSARPERFEPVKVVEYV